MEAIIIDKEKFERECQATLDKLKLETLDAIKDLPHKMETRAELQALHRKFHYEICKLVERLRKT